MKVAYVLFLLGTSVGSLLAMETEAGLPSGKPSGSSNQQEAPPFVEDDGEVVVDPSATQSWKSSDKRARQRAHDLKLAKNSQDDLGTTNGGGSPKGKGGTPKKADTPGKGSHNGGKKQAKW